MSYATSSECNYYTCTTTCRTIEAIIPAGNMASDHGQYIVFNSIDWFFDVRFLEPVITWAVMIDCEEFSLRQGADDGYPVGLELLLR